LEAANMLAPDNNKPDFTAAITLLTTGALTPLENAARRWLQLPAQCCASMDLSTKGINPVE
jgi:glutamate racemase